MKAYFEISPLFEDVWTGIPVVTAAIAERALDDTDSAVEWQFLYETIPLPNNMVGSMLETRTGRAARDSLPQLLWEVPPVDWRDGRAACAIFANIKPMRRYFAREAMIIYDLSPLLTPQFHNVDSINHYANRLSGDVESTDHFFCISEATRRDLEVYMGVDRSATSLIRMGMDAKWEDVSSAQRISDECDVEPYVVVVGTLEPRKNGRIVLQFLASNPGFARRYRIVFVGRNGWLEEREKMMAEIVSSGIPAERILFTGYVTDEEKMSLIYNSRFCIYPSFFEGFGLPVVEAGVLGKTIVCSSSSSMPEVLPEQCCFFDPNSIVEFGWAMSEAEERASQCRVSSSLRDVMARVNTYDWSVCYAEVKRWILE